MAYGLDITDLIYTDSKKQDLGTLSDYKVDLDVAGTKDFELTIGEFILPLGGYWYVDGEEYGGKITGYKTNPGSNEITYTGPNWRGILNNKVILTDGNVESDTVSGPIRDVTNDLLKKCDLRDLFVCDNPDIHPSIDTITENGDLDELSIYLGESLYDCLTALAKEIGFVYRFEFNASDKKVHMIPEMADDYSEDMMYSKDNALQLQLEIDQSVPNHYVVIGYEYNDDGAIATTRMIHVFTDENGELQPFYKENGKAVKYTAETNKELEPLDDSQYIKDTSQQILKGDKEVVSFIEVDNNVTSFYRMLTKAPSKWKKNFGDYYVLDIVTDDDTGDTREEYNRVESIVKDYGVMQEIKPSDWSTNYENYYTISYNPDDPNREGTYVGGKLWKGFTFSGVSGESKTDRSKIRKITKKPKYWKKNCTNYSYFYDIGAYSEEKGNDLRNYSIETKTKYIKLRREPSDWKKNFTGYYKKMFQETIKKKNKKGKTTKTTKLHSSKKKNNWKTVWVALDKDDIPKKRRKKYKYPEFKKNKYYTTESKNKYPKFKKNNTYLAATKTVAPKWEKETYYTVTTKYTAPSFDDRDYYEVVNDHYMAMVQAAIDQWENDKTVDSQTVTLDELETFKIGDTVGGIDDITGTEVVEVVQNIIVKIESGVIYTEYEIGGDSP